MPVNLSAPVASHLQAVPGVRIGVAEAGVRKAGRKDLTVMLLDAGTSVGGVFTSNRFCAAPVQICRERLQGRPDIRALMINTGNANAGTGEDGLARARQTSAALAALLKIEPAQVLPFSTGVIMEPLPVDRIVAGLPAAIADAQPAHWARAAEGIMTTDTVPKAASAKAMVGGVEVTITGISKGAGMIRPNMATMLGFIATDARIVPALVQPLARTLADAAPDHWARAAEGIMTTDTVPKAFSAQAKVGGAEITITGISKGAGMIRPNMATMLGFLATDARVDQSVMHQLALELAEGSFNRVTIDGDTSTNDSFIVIATNQAANAPVTSLDSADGQALKQALLGVARLLAQAIVRDGEGATKFITVQVDGGKTAAECRQVAYAIAHSPLVKTAFFASDPNLGRILAAVGYAGIEDLDQTRIDLHLDDVHVAVNGGRNPAYREEDGQRVMKQSEITVRVNLGRGTASDTVWTCDLSHDYVSINADYRS